MQLITTGRTAYILQNEDGRFAGSLMYRDHSLSEAVLKCAEELYFTVKEDGSWITTKSQGKVNISIVKVSMGGTILLTINEKKYTFRKPLNWKLRFVILNAEKEEVLGLLPKVNWNKKCYDFVLQLNDELISESDSFVILQALHCAVCSMAMMNGTLVATVGCIT